MVNVPDATIKISLPGKSAHSKNYIDDFVFVGGFPTAQIKKRLKITLTTNDVDGTGQAKIEHGFGYRPQAICFVTTRAATVHELTYINVPGNWPDYDEIFGMQSSESFDCYVDEQYVYVTAFSSVFIPMFFEIFRADTYVFDVLLLMEEAESA